MKNTEIINQLREALEILLYVTEVHHHDMPITVNKAKIAITRSKFYGKG
ncbi:hypothetical protein KAR91_14550 [Candidatus Pacearchaeota archaeon]|nr:hypothetical protein [Candidatus Pacearchaeota archaeon]